MGSPSPSAVRNLAPFGSAFGVQPCTPSSRVWWAHFTSPRSSDRANDRPLTLPAPESLTIDPAPPRWLDALRARPALTEAQRTFRQEVGLPTTGHIVMTGHQAEFWHVGILAKYFAADAAARTATAAGTSTTAAWLVVDHDTNDPGYLRVPVLRHDQDGDLEQLAELTLHLSGKAEAGVAACERPALVPSDADLARVRGERVPTLEISAGAERMLALLREHAGAPNAAAQHARVLRDLLAPLALHAPVIQGTALARTTLFRRMISRMIADPEGCVTSYNAAAGTVPEAGLTPLVFDPVQDRFELPLWRLRPGVPRQRVFAEDLHAIPSEELAPRALLLTAVVRLAGCDLFVHGLGGGLYDRATEGWIRSWMPDAALAPTAIVTATRYLALPPPPEGEPLPRALWRLHHARHNPALLGEEHEGERKRDLVRRIADAKARGDNPYALYRVMHTLLKSVRESRERELGELARAVERSRALAREERLRRDRTWAFPLHGEAALRTLQRQIDAAFGV